MKGNGFQKFWKIVLVVALGIILSGSANAQSSTGKVYKARFSYNWYPTLSSAINSELWAKRVREKTKGQVDITTYGSAQLYNLQQIVTAISTGAVEIGGVVDTSFEAVDPDTGIAALPYYWDGFDKIRRLWQETSAGRKHWEGMQTKLNIKILAYITNGAVMIFNTQKPLLTPADISGMKVRYLSKAEIPVFASMGASPIFIQTTEMYTALQNGQVAALPTHIEGVKGYNLWDFLKFGTKPYLNYRDAYIVANGTWWNNLPEDLRNTIMKEVSVPLTEEVTKLCLTNSDKVIAEWESKHGGKLTVLTKEQQAAFMKVFREKVWPNQTAKMDPDLIAAAEKLTGISIK